MTDARVRILYLSGWQRSGSTILAGILGQIDGLFSTGELYYLWDYVWKRDILCGCGRRFRECSLWTQVVRRAFGSEEGVDAAAMWRMALHAGRTRRLPWLMVPGLRQRTQRELSAYVANLRLLYGAVVATTGSRILVDSSKWPSYGRVLGMIPGIDLRVVHLVRDPRAVAYSWARRKVLPDRDPPEYMYRTPIDSSLHWNAWNVATEAFWRRDVLRLRYEDFVRRPEASVNRILEFAGEKPRRLPFLSGRTLDLGRNHTVSGNPLRLRQGPVKIAEDDEWKERMSRRDRALVTLLTLPLLHRYGYLASDREAPDLGSKPRRRSA